MNNSLRDEIKKIKYWQGIDGDPDFPEDVYDSIPDGVIDQILSLVASKMPEKNHITQLSGNSRLDQQVFSEIKGWNAYHDSVKSILKGEESQ